MLDTVLNKNRDAPAAADGRRSQQPCLDKPPVDGSVTDRRIIRNQRRR